MPKENAKTLEDLVNSVDVTPLFFTREDGKRIAILDADFYDRIHAVYAEATSTSLSEHPELQALIDADNARTESNED